jgi:hypothetical protein
VSELNLLKSITQHNIALGRHYVVIIFSINSGFTASINLRSINLTNLLSSICFRPLVLVTTKQVDNSSPGSCSHLIFCFLFFLCSCPSLYITIMFSTLSHCCSTMDFLIDYRFIILKFVKRVLKWFIYLLVFFVVYEEIIRGFLLSCGK